jgi:hypothetical protein
MRKDCTEFLSAGYREDLKNTGIAVEAADKMLGLIKNLPDLMGQKEQLTNHFEMFLNINRQTTNYLGYGGDTFFATKS